MPFAEAGDLAVRHRLSPAAHALLAPGGQVLEYAICPVSLVGVLDFGI